MCLNTTGALATHLGIAPVLRGAEYNHPDLCVGKTCNQEEYENQSESHA
jgi:hypothetical protein